MNQYVKRTQRDYPLSFKLAVVEQVEKGEMTYRQAQDRYGIQGRSTVLKWLRKFGQLDWLSPSPARMYGFQILRCSRLLVMPKRAYHKTTNSHHRFYRHPNLLKSGANQVIASRPEQVWVADITYLPLRTGTAYVSLVTDARSRKIVGYHVHESLHTRHVAAALKMALVSRRTASALIHHSDRGIQYCSTEYQALHQRHGVICSMTDGYDCYQNALAERVNGILKLEYLLVKPEDIGRQERWSGSQWKSTTRGDRICR